ncbi:hypothetical protein [Actinomadura luteofluorescens]|uniref:hypothetical protein n=1 Tax=Actinomadura luteofluorescens TaxID=46163 RepID=UPI0030CDC6F7
MLIAVVTEARVLVVVADLIMMNHDHIDWPAANRLVCVTGGLLWGAAALAHRRTADRRCAQCGDSPAGATTPRMSRSPYR